MTLYTFTRNLLFFLTALAIGSNCLYAQKRSSFSEIQNLDRFSTLSTRFEYIQNKRDTVLDGRFSIESLVRNKGVDSSGTFEGFSVDYKKGKPEGLFTYTIMEFSPTPVSVFNDYRVTRRLNGLAWETQGQIKNNKPFQTWEAIGRKVKESEVLEDFGIYSVQFINGMLNGDFTFSDTIQGIFINGIFGANNMFDGTLFFRGKQPFDLHFEKGLLTKFIVGNQTVFYQEYSEKAIPASPIPLDESFENYIQTLTKIVRARTIDHEFAFDYDEAIKKILYMVNAFEIVTGSKPMTRNLARTPIPLVGPMIQLPIYPLSEQEKANYNSFFALTEGFVKTSDSMIAIPAFSLSSFNNVEITRLFQKVKMIRNYAYRFNGLVSEINTAEFIHFDRMLYLKTKLKYYFSGSYKIDFVFENEKQYVELNFPNYDSSKTALENAENILTYLERELEDISIQITEKMRNIKSEERLKNNEAQIAQLANNIDNILEKSETVLYNSAITRKLIDAIIRQKKNIILAYTSTSKRQKTTVGEETVHCLTLLEEILLSFPDLHEREKAIYEGYHENELNPVTWTRMETTLHERLFNAYQDKLIPFAINQIVNFEDPNCRNFSEIFNNLIRIQNFMLKIAEENPGRANRRLRNNDSVETILSKLDLELAK